MKSSSLSQVTTGAAIIGVGALLLLDTLRITDGALGTWWPLFLIAMGVIALINDRSSYLWALVLMFAGVLFQLRMLDIIALNPWEFFWPVVIILAGVSVITNHYASKKVSTEAREDLSAIFSGVDHVSAAEDYEGGNVTAIFGGVKLDMRKAVIKKEATLNVVAFCGGVELVVPEGVIVKTRASCIMGGIENKHPATVAKNAPVLYIGGTLVMGGVEVKR